MQYSIYTWLTFVTLISYNSNGFVQGFSNGWRISSFSIRNRIICNSMDNDNNNNNNNNNKFNVENNDVINAPVLSAQERILQEALGISPESEEEKLERCIQCELEQQRLQDEKKTNIGVAALSFLVALVTYAWQYTHPMPAVQLLAQMQEQSAPLTVIGNNGKPTVMDFWAPWCENCKAEAPTMKKIETVYGNRVNFILVNADQGEAWPLIERFGVDAIPHMAMISSSGSVETALIGEVPGSILKQDIDALLEGKDRDSLPFVMYDAFSSRPDQRQVTFNGDNASQRRVLVNEVESGDSISIDGLPYSIDR